MGAPHPYIYFYLDLNMDSGYPIPTIPLLYLKKNKSPITIQSKNYIPFLNRDIPFCNQKIDFAIARQ